MPTRTPVDFLTPPGRLVWGSVHTARLQKDDKTGQPKLIKSGPDQGKPLHMYQFGIAIPKTQAHWKDETFTDANGNTVAWGAIIYNEGVSAWPRGEWQKDNFAWKVQDGSSEKLNNNMKRPCDQTGYAGNWILSYSGIGAPQLLDASVPGQRPSVTSNEGIMLPGDFVQILGSVVSNESNQTAGVYLNHRAVAFRGLSPLGRITQQADVNPDAFGMGGLAQGAVMTPPPAALPLGDTAVSAPPVAAPPAPTAVTPSTTFVPAAPPVPVAKLTAEQDGWAPHPDNAAFMWKGSEVLPVADVRARYA